jgi:hypothetical protein
MVMCQFISFFHNIETSDIKVHDLNSHSNTEEYLKLDKSKWREGHYLPDGTIIARVLPTDQREEAQCVFKIQQSYPTFLDFFAWALREITHGEEDYKGDLDLRGLTSLTPGCLPKTVGGSLDLRGLTSLTPGCLPKTMGGDLYLGGLTSLTPGCLPKTVGGYLYLPGLTSLTPGCLPKTVGGYLYLGGLTSLTPGCLPKTVGGDLDLGGLNAKDRELVRKQYGK